MLGMMTALAFAISVLLLPDDAPPELTAEIVSVNGTGCPGKTAEVKATGDRKAFTLTYGTDFVAKAGAGAKPTDFRRNCQINLRLKYSADFTFAIKKFDHHGSAKLQAGASGVLRASHYFAGEPSKAPAQHTFSGPLNDKWDSADDVADEFTVPCGQNWNLNVNTEVRINKGSSTELSTMSMGTAGYQLHWKKC